MKKYWISSIVLLSFLAGAVISCTNFRADGIALGGVTTTVDKLSFSSSGSERSLVVTSGEVWSVTSIPSWLKIRTINSRGFSWDVTVAAEANNDYDRSGTLILRSSSSTASIAVSQDGKKGAYVPVTSVSLSPQTVEITEGDTRQLTATISPSNASVKDVSWKSSSTSIATVSSSGLLTAVSEGTATITVTTKDGNKTASCQAIVMSNASGIENGYYWVDLGLPSGLKWATCNVGATSPSDYGSYFAWGETTTKSDYSWSTLKYCTDTSVDHFSKYVPADKPGYWSGNGSPDNKKRLDMSDDAARANWGGSWRMPTDAEWTELIEKCTWTWTTQGGKNGHKVTSKTNGNSIFLPAAGGRNEDSLYDAGFWGDYWSSSLSTSYPYNAWLVYFNSSGVYGSTANRSLGFSVRPVCGDPVRVSSVSLNKTQLSLNVGGSEQLTATVSPSNAAEKGVNWSSNNSSVASVDSKGLVTAKQAGTATITATTVDGGYTANCTVTVKSTSTTGYENGHEWVDLGLSVKWATYNVGASSPSDYGSYFAWGETSTKNDYSWSTYKWCNGSYNSLTKYNNSSDYGGIIDYKTRLELSDDAARANWGGSWRMPTDAEWTELREKCTWTWTTQNGKNGYKVTSKTNGNSIFLPAAGYPSVDSLIYAGSYGGYWSSSLDTSYPYNAWIVNFNSSAVGRHSSYRYHGFSVRPVTE